MQDIVPVPRMGIFRKLTTVPIQIFNIFSHTQITNLIKRLRGGERRQDQRRPAEVWNLNYLSNPSPAINVAHILMLLPPDKNRRTNFITRRLSCKDTEAVHAHTQS